MSERRLSPREAAPLLHCSARTVRRLLQARELGGWRAGGRWFTSARDVELYWSRRRRPARGAFLRPRSVAEVEYRIGPIPGALRPAGRRAGEAS